MKEDELQVEKREDFGTPTKGRSRSMSSERIEEEFGQLVKRYAEPEIEKQKTVKDGKSNHK